MRRSLSLCLALVALVALLPAGSAGQAPAAKPAVPAGEPDKVVFATDFGFNGRHSPYFTALDKFFKEMNLEGRIVRGAGSLDAIRQAAAGNATAAFADLSALIAMRANENVPVKLLAIVYTRSPHALYCLPESGIKTARDLDGRRLADSAASTIPKVFPAYAKAMGTDPAKVKWVFTDSASLPALLVSKQVDCVGQFTVGEPLLRKAAGGRDLVRLAYADAPGLDYYGSGIVATDEMIRTKPELLRRIVWAMRQGLAYAFDHPDEAAQIMNRHHPQVAVDVARAETVAVRELAVTPDTRQHGIGWVDPARVQKTIDLMTSSLELKRKVTVEEVYAAGFLGR